MAFRGGDIIDGRFRVVRLLGEGGMGAVYEAERLEPQSGAAGVCSRRVAIKVVRMRVSSRAILGRFEREARAASSVGTIHVAHVFGFGKTQSGEPYIAMEYLEGESLEERIAAKKRLSERELAPILIELLRGLREVHLARILHCDLKPANVFLTRYRGGEVVKILDFGVSEFVSCGADLPVDSAPVGTPIFMSPEQLAGRSLDARTDLYSVGVMAYYALRGSPPFEGESLRELVFKISFTRPVPLPYVLPRVDVRFAELVEKAMAHHPADRYQTAWEFERALLEWQEESALSKASQISEALLRRLPRRARGVVRPSRHA